MTVLSPRTILSVLALVLLPLAGHSAPDGPVPPREAAGKMTVPEGFQVTLFAGEPDVVQPIAFAIDDRGRLWVAECFSYPHWIKDGKEGKDRIVIFEDTDGDGRFDKRTVFHDRLANVSGIQLGFGGVWVCATPNLLFIPDRNGDDVPDGPPQVMLDGWDLQAQHNVFNSLTWGPDGWLYGCNGILSNSRIGPPGTPAADRAFLNCGVWRYHPLTRRTEAVAHGTTNPWGLDFDDYGEMFITNCVIEHVFHVIPGGHYKRMFGQDVNPHAYSLLQTCADHIHWAGGHWTESRGGQGEHGDAGGGHAHSGAMVYLGDNWPARYRNGLFTCNIHGNRVNHDLLERAGSSYKARHGKDFLFANDPWFRGLAVQYGPDGGVFVSDWTDTGECHNYKVADKTNGRIYKVTYGKAGARKEDLGKLSDRELVRRQLHANDWHVRHARRLLQERAAAGKLDPQVKTELRNLFDEDLDETRKLRVLWALHCIGAPLPEGGGEHVRAWTIRLRLEDRKPPAELLDQLAVRAQTDPSPLVRLSLASGLQRVEVTQRWPIAEALVAHQEDAADAMIPLMLWYAVEPLAPADPVRAQALLLHCKIPLVREYLARRLTTLGATNPAFDALVAALGKVDDPLIHRDALRGMLAALGGQRDVPMPKAWEAAYPVLLASPLAEVHERCLALAAAFGDQRALALLRQTAQDRRAPTARREFALQTLIFKHQPDVAPVLLALLDDPHLRRPAIRGLAAFDRPEAPALLFTRYHGWDDATKADALQTLAARPSYAFALLDAVAANRVPRTDVSAFTMRQVLALKDAKVTARVEAVWGKIRPPARDKTAVIAKYKAALTPAALRQANLANGRAVYAKSCAACHRLFGEGGDVGPELTGSQRGNLDYVLENILDPSAIVARDYQVSVVVTTSGRVLTGIVKAETPQAITVQTQNEQVIVPKDEIESRTVSALSMMPEGLLDALRTDEVRDLAAYLASPGPMAPPGR